MKVRLIAVGILILGALVGFFVYNSEANVDSPFKLRLGLDLTGGTHLVYEADTSALASPHDVRESMEALRDVVERRVNLFGVSEPVVQVERSSIVTGADEQRLIVELPGVDDVDEAIRIIGETPLLEFKLLEFDQGEADVVDGVLEIGANYTDTGLTGALVQRAQLSFGGQHGGGISNEPVVLLEFNAEGTKLFADLTTEHVGEQIAIFLDGEVVSSPVVQEPIPNGTAVISGNFTPDEARNLVRDLNFGALPVPIELLATQLVDASLGGEAFDRGVMAGIWGLGAVALFMLVWYRLPGLVAVIALAIYIALMLTVFKLIPVTLTAAGVVGFILSIGMAVDANVLIFERMREELKTGKAKVDAIRDGFTRAWRSIRDGNISSVLTAIILFWLGTSIVEGFALVFGLGVLISMLTAITVTRTLLLAIQK